MGGENVSDGESVNRYEGSPPHRRGKVIKSLSFRWYSGITPAQAGKSRWSRGPGGCGSDHPRAGGEKPTRKRWTRSTTGSPPRGRGKAFTAAKVAVRHRITPAWAGKSLVTPSIPQTRGDHPRVGGEKTVTEKGETQRTGSPPRRRGKDRRLVVDVLPEGITPAWAGKSLASQPWSPPLWMMVIRPRP